MSLDLLERVPPSLAPCCAAMTIGRDAACPRACRLGDAGRLDAALDAFASAYESPDRGALVSLWSMYYLASLVVPATAALLCRDRVLPVGFDEIGVTLDDGGLAAFRLDDAGKPADLLACRRFETLVEGHLAPFVDLCACRSGLSPRVFWSNAAVVLDWACDQLRGTDDLCATACAEAEALLAGHSGERRLARPLRCRADGSRERRVCCLRYRLPGVDDCGALCPRHTASGRQLSERSPAAG